MMVDELVVIVDNYENREITDKQMYLYIHELNYYFASPNDDMTTCISMSTFIRQTSTRMRQYKITVGLLKEHKKHYNRQTEIKDIKRERSKR